MATSNRDAKLAGKALSSRKGSKQAKSIAGSDLAQAKRRKEK